MKALGNQLGADKIKQVILLEPLPYDAPKEEIPEEMEVIGEIQIEGSDIAIQLEDDGQIGLSFS